MKSNICINIFIKRIIYMYIYYYVFIINYTEQQRKQYNEYLNDDNR